MQSLVECVPNFSEGRRPKVLDAIAGDERCTPRCNCWISKATRITTGRSSRW